MNLKWIVAMMLVAACGKGSPCKQAVQHMTDLASAEGDKKANADTMKQFQIVGDALAGACEKDNWSAKAIECIKTAADFKAQRACEDLLTPEQQKRSEQAVADAMDKAPHPGQAGKDDVLKQIADQRDRMCACKDAACAEAVDHEWKALKTASEQARHDPDTKTKFNEIDDARFACYERLTKK